MKNWILAVSLLSSAANSAVISYSVDQMGYNDGVNNIGALHGNFTFDTDSLQLLDFNLHADGLTVTSAGPSDIWSCKNDSYTVLCDSAIDFERTTSSGTHNTRSYLFFDAAADDFSFLNHVKEHFLFYMDIFDSGSSHWVAGQAVPTGESPAEVPEPTSIALLGLGLAASAFRRRGKRQP